MRYVTENEPIILTMDYILEGLSRVPDAGSVTYTLRDYTGTVIGAQSDIAVPDPNPISNISIDGSHNTLGGNRIAVRHVIVKWTSGTVPYEQRVTYKVIPWLLYAVSPEEVRKNLGVNRGEVTDEDIDLNQAYLQLENHVGQTEFEAAFASGDIRSIRINEALAIYAALQFIPTLPLRIAQSETNGTRRFDRLKKINWSDLEETLKSRFEQSLNTALARVEVTPTIFTVSTQEDPFGDA